MMCEFDKIAVTMEVLCEIAMDGGRMLAERQRAIDALTLFRESLQTMEYISRKTDLDILRQRAGLYIQRMKSGAHISMSAV
ncbi:MAG TPA: hypothetical protein PLG94_02025 [Smithellaceae bacterium]|nr:hypothetical protein [Smithellaceae bacterium]HOS28716.1 hypothetical protein [Deltaproteobacteria bacterium]HPL65272.1 hypothetical protein [Smithellaceae bacterium]